MAEKRPAAEDPGGGQLVKRPNLGSSRAVTRSTTSGNSGALVQANPRTSGLQAPLMELAGHTGDIFTAKFDPSGNLIASGSMDRTIMLWRTYGDCENYGVLTGHKGAVLDLQWSRDSDVLFSASADAHLASWDLTTGTRIRRYVGHDELVNALDVSRRGEELLFSAGDDGAVGIWDPRSKHAAGFIETDHPVTAVAVSEAGNDIYTGGIDNDIHVWDSRKTSSTSGAGAAPAPVYSMAGHRDTVTSLRVSPADGGQLLLSYGMDSTARTWDVRPFAPVNRAVRTFDGAPFGIEPNLIRGSWDPQGRRVAVGAGDGTVVVWSSDTGKLLYKLPGHKGTVNCAEFSPGIDPIILSASTDRTMLLGELM